MTLYEELQADWKTAFKAREKEKKDILNFVVAQVKQKQIDERRDLSDDEVIKIIKKEIKSRKESISFMSVELNQEDIQIENNKISFLEVYLPQMLTPEELSEVVNKKIQELGIEDPKKQRWQLIWPIMKEYGATVDGWMLNWIINSL